MTPPPLDLCPSCQAPHSPEEAFCWMCHHRFWDDSAPAPKPSSPAPVLPPAPAPAPAAATRPGSEPVFVRTSGPSLRVEEKTSPASAFAEAWTQPILIAAFILILTGLALGKGMGTSLLWLGMLPAFFVTAMAGFRSPTKKPETLVEWLVWLATKLASAFAIIVLSLIAILIALAAACFAIIAVVKH